MPKPTSKSTDSDESRSIGSNASRGRRLIQQIGNRLRSSSRASSTGLEAEPLGEKEFKQVDSWLDAFDKYNQLVTNQVSRDPSYPPEKFAKLCEILTKKCEGGGFVHGLPEALFDLALLWCPAERQIRKEVSTKEPSWSWTGWKGAVNFPFDPTNCPDVRQLTGNFFKSEIARFNIGPEDRPYTLRRETRRVRIQYPYDPAAEGSDRNTNSNTLRFKAHVISADSFTAHQLGDENNKDIACSELVDYQGHHCGNIMDYKELFGRPTNKPGPFQFVLLSRNRHCEPATVTRKPVASTIHPPGTPMWDGERFLWDKQLEEFDANIFEDGEWKMLNVMLIQWQEEGYFERVAIARMHEDAWKAQNPVRKDIVLR